MPVVSTRPARTHAATGSVASSRCTAASSDSSRTRAVGVRSTEGTRGSADADDGRPGGHAAALSSAIRMASSMRVSTIWDSGTVLTTSPLTKIWPLPLPDATPRSASRASPGPLTTQPMTATRSGTSMPSRPAVTSSASV